MKKFSRNEKKLIFGMGLLMGIRMLGVSMIVPVLSHFAENLNGSSEQAVGLAIGIFGFSQTIFQIPMGSLSDKLGRKEVSLLGFVIYLIGTMMCGFSKDINFLMIARFIAGAGAVSGVALTWITDGINEKWRNTAVSYLGMSIGASVILGFPLSWLIASRFGAHFVFFSCAAATLLAIIFTFIFLKNNEKAGGKSGSFDLHEKTLSVIYIMKNSDLARLNTVGFIGSLCLTGIFNIMPRILVDEIGKDSMWLIFAPIAVIGTMFMFFFARKADKHGTVTIALIGLGFELLCLVLLIITRGTPLLILSFIFFYSGHCILSPILPVAVSRYPNNLMKGTTMSLFTSSQFLGMGIGGVFSGYILEHFSPTSLFLILSVLVIISIISIFGFKDFQGGGLDINIGTPLDSID